VAVGHINLMGFLTYILWWFWRRFCFELIRLCLKLEKLHFVFSY
jgi:hypothetical protein